MIVCLCRAHGLDIFCMHTNLASLFDEELCIVQLGAASE